MMNSFVLRSKGRGSYIPFILFLFGFAFLAFVPPLTSRWLDFPVYWEAGKKAVLGQSVYDVPGHFQYKYSPFVALIFGKLFGPFSFAAASWIFQKTMLTTWFLLFLRLSKGAVWSLCFAVLLFGNALKLDLELGQINALVLFMLVYLFDSIEKSPKCITDVRFGVLFSFAVQLKLFALILLPLLFFRREWKKLIFGILFIPILSLLGVALAHGFSFALAENGAWLISLGSSTDGLVYSEQNVGLLGFLSRALSENAFFAKLFWVLSGFGFLIFLYRNQNQSNTWFRNVLIYGVSIFNPLAWSYWILYALPLYFYSHPHFVTIFMRKRKSAVLYGSASLFVFLAFNGQHARWAWKSGILVSLLLLGWAALFFEKRSEPV